VGRQRAKLLRIRSTGKFRCCTDSACLFSGVEICSGLIAHAGAHIEGLLRNIGGERRP
jgi:hypothetical protein